MKRDRPSGCDAFSLLELLVVMAILAALAVVAIPSLQGNNSALQLTSSARALQGEFSLAQQAALARSVTVEVRFYLLADQADSAKTARIYRGYQSFVVADDGTYQPLTKVIFLPTGIAMATGSGFSTLITDFAPQAGTFSVPTVGTSYQYVAFEFKSDGSTNLSANPVTGSVWCVTIQPLKGPEGATAGLKQNFAALQLDPITGRVKLIRP